MALVMPTRGPTIGLGGGGVPSSTMPIGDDASVTDDAVVGERDAEGLAELAGAVGEIPIGASVDAGPGSRRAPRRAPPPAAALPGRRRRGPVTTLAQQWIP